MKNFRFKISRILRAYLSTNVNAFADGNILIDGNGDFIWEGRTFDIQRKTYDRMPEELQKAFNKFQVDTVIHEYYTMQQISRLVHRFNFNKGMTVSPGSYDLETELFGEISAITIKLEKYLATLSKRQKEVLNLLSYCYQAAEIQQLLHMTQKEYTDIASHVPILLTSILL